MRGDVKEKRTHEKALQAFLELSLDDLHQSDLNERFGLLFIQSVSPCHSVSYTDHAADYVLPQS
jgi:hypothetical protein